jgi:hypothetical protein
LGVVAVTAEPRFYAFTYIPEGDDISLTPALNQIPEGHAVVNVVPVNNGEKSWWVVHVDRRPPIMPTLPRAEVDYTNYRGERSLRSFVPTGRVLPGDPKFHPGVRWVLEVVDAERGVLRTVDLDHVHSWGGALPAKSSTSPEAVPLKLEDGKFYRNGGGEKVGPLYRRDGLWYSRNKAPGGDWWDDGRALHGLSDKSCDLVAEWVESAPPQADPDCLAAVEAELVKIERQVEITCHSDRHETAAKQSDPLPTVVELSLSHVRDSVARVRALLFGSGVD